MSELHTTSAPVFKRLLGYVMAYRGVFALSVVAVALDAAGQGLFFYLLRPLIDQTVVSPEPVFSLWLPGLVMAAVILRIIGNFGGVYGMEWVGRRLIADMRCDVFEQYLRLPSQYYDRHSPGEMISVISYNAEQVAQGATTALIGATRDLLTVIALVSVMLLQSWRLTLAMLLLAPVIAVIVSVISVRFRRLSRDIQGSMGGVTHLTEESVIGQEVIKVYGGQAHEARSFKHEAEKNRKLHLKLAVTQLVSSSMIQLAAGLAVVLLLILTASDWLKGSVSAGIFMSVLAAMVACIPPLKRLTKVHVVIEKAMAAAVSIFDILDAQPETDTGQRLLKRAKGEIEIKNVSFAYEISDRPILSEVTLSLKPGTMTALVGRSGSGKSSLMKLLPRFYEPTDGEITIDGYPLNSVSLHSLRQNIALVSQDIVLFNDTISANIAYGSEAAVSSESIEQAAMSACAMEFIDKLPGGMQTKLGPGGISLSGGQRQRIAIARAWLKNAPILLLDEATSGLDAESEKWIQEALSKLVEHRTCLVVAHQLSTIKKADQVVVLDRGRIAEIGTHNELIGIEDGLYRHLYYLQFSQNE